jgi:hypothetical protein
MPIEIMYKLVYASKSIHDISTPSLTNLAQTELYSDNLDINNCLRNLDSYALHTPKVLTISNIEHGYTATSPQSMFIQQFDTESANLNKISTYNTALAVTNLNTQDALRSAKQDR